MTFVSSPLLSDLWCHLNLEAHTHCLWVSVFNESYRSGDIICHSQGLRVCVCGGGQWRWMHESFYLLYVFGQEWTWISRWAGCSFATSHHCTAIFLSMPKKGYLSIKQIHPSYSDSSNSLCVFIRCCCFISHNSSSQGKENSPKGYRDWREI